MATRMRERIGLSKAAQHVTEHARNVVQLQIELARRELVRKAKALGIGIGLLAGAGLFALVGLLFALAAAAAALTLAIPVWAALLVMFGAMFLLTGLLGTVGLVLLKKGSPPIPEQALAEAKVTTEALRNGHS